MGRSTHQPSHDVHKAARAWLSERGWTGDPLTEVLELFGADDTGAVELDCLAAIGHYNRRHDRRWTAMCPPR